MIFYHSSGKTDTNIFVPAAGYIRAGSATYEEVGTAGYIRSSEMYPTSPQKYNQLWGLWITSAKCQNEDCTNRTEGINIRPVQE